MLNALDFNERLNALSLRHFIFFTVVKRFIGVTFLEKIIT
jgi:hypothetical protein